RPSEAARETFSVPSGFRSRCRSKRVRASSGETTSRNCSWRAAARTASSRRPEGISNFSVRSLLMTTISWQQSHLSLGTGGKAFALRRNQNPAIGTGERLQGEHAGTERLGTGFTETNQHDFGQAHSGRDFLYK